MLKNTNNHHNSCKFSLSGRTDALLNRIGSAKGKTTPKSTKKQIIFEYRSDSVPTFIVVDGPFSTIK